MNHSILYYIALAYALCSGAIALGGLAVLAILSVKSTRLIDLAPQVPQAISHNVIDS